MTTETKDEVRPDGGADDAADWRARLFGARVVECSSGRVVSTPRALQARSAHSGTPQVVGLYFSFANIAAAGASLSQQLRALHDAQPQLQVLQVVLWTRSDEHVAHAEEFDRHVRGQPWYAVPFEDFRTQKRLTRKYRIKVGEPTLVLVDGGDSGGAELARPSREQLDKPSGFPWRPRTVDKILEGKPLEDCQGRSDGSSLLAYSGLPKTCTVAFYFGAHWCPPCKALTPQLVNTYHLVRARGHDFRIIFISSDRSEESFTLSCAGMPWLRLGWQEAAARAEIARALGVHGIPALRAPRGHEELRRRVAGDPDGLNFPWLRCGGAQVHILTDYYLTKLERQQAFVLVVDTVSLDEGCAALLSAAEPHLKASLQETSPPTDSDNSDSSDSEGPLTSAPLLLACDSEEKTEALLLRLGIQDMHPPLLLICDLPHARYVCFPLQELSTTAFKKPTQDYFRERLSWSQLPPIWD